MKKSVFVNTSCPESFGRDVTLALGMFYTVVSKRGVSWGGIDRVFFEADAVVVIGAVSTDLERSLRMRRENGAPICYIACPCSQSVGTRLGAFPTEEGYKKLLKIVDAALRGERQRSSVTHSKARP